MTDDEPKPVPAELIPAEILRVGQALPGLARIAATAWWNTTEWGVLTTWKLTRRFVAASRDPELANRLAQELGIAVGTATELARRVADGTPLPQAIVEITQQAQANEAAVDPREKSARDLRARGEELLQRSRDVWNTDQAHPAYERILGELAPDEARILVFLYRHGPQPSVDVRTGGPVGMVSSRLVAPGLNMIGPRAGVRYGDAVPSYLNNLFRLGLLWFSRETLPNPGAYQVLEAQPDVLAAMKSISFAKVVRRSIHLTPFGRDFCRAALTDEGPVEGVPDHADPLDGDHGAPPEPE